MAKPRKITKTVIEEEEDTQEVEQPQFGFEGNDSPEALDRILEQFGAEEVRLKVYRKTDKGLSFCFNATEDVDEASIQEGHGGGSYVIKIFVSGKFKRSIELLISEKRIGTPPGLVPAMEYQQGGGDPRGLEARLLREQVAFMQNLLLQQRQNQTPLSELAEAFKAFGGGNHTNGEGDFDKFLKMFELVKTMNGGGEVDWKTELVRTAKDVAAPVLREMASRQMGAGAPAPNPSVQQQQQPAITEGGAQVIPSDTMIKQGIEFLKSKVMSGMDVGLATDWIVENASDPMYSSFIQFILAQPFEYLQKVDPTLAQPPYEAWFKTLHTGLKEAFANEPEQQSAVGADTPRAGGNVTDIASNAAAGKRGGGKSRAS